MPQFEFQILTHTTTNQVYIYEEFWSMRCGPWLMHIQFQIMICNFPILKCNVQCLSSIIWYQADAQLQMQTQSLELIFITARPKIMICEIQVWNPDLQNPRIQISYSVVYMWLLHTWILSGAWLEWWWGGWLIRVWIANSKFWNVNLKSKF